MNEFDVYILIDASGEYVVGKCEQTARDAYEEEVGGLNECAKAERRSRNLMLNILIEEALKARGLWKENSE